MKKIKNKINNNSVGLAGEFAVLSQLAIRNFDAGMTLGHTKGVDILISNPKNNEMYKLEVKTNHKKIRNKPATSKLFGKIVSEWQMDEKHELISDLNLFYCFVNIEKETNKFSYYIVPSMVVAKYVKEQHQLWLDNSSSSGKPHKQNPMRLFRIGLNSGIPYKVNTPTIEQYQDNWNFLQ